MFGMIKKKKERPVYAPMSGKILALSDVDDAAFSEKMLGDGVAILPDENAVYSPVDGVITDVTDTKHAFCITAEDGTELLLHIGINTVTLKGEGFQVFVSGGDHVRAGDKIADVDLSALSAGGLSAQTPVLLTEFERVHIVETREGSVQGGKDVLFTYRRNK